MSRLYLLICTIVFSSHGEIVKQYDEIILTILLIVGQIFVCCASFIIEIFMTGSLKMDDVKYARTGIAGYVTHVVICAVKQWM